MRFAQLGLLIGVVAMAGCQAMGEKLANEYAPPAPPAGVAAAPSADVPGSLGGKEAAEQVKLASAETSNAAQPAGRLIIYNAALNIVVPDIARAMETVRSEAVRLGGYLQEMEASAITVRVPAPRFADAISACEKLGEVAQRHVKALDITEEMRDLKIRLDNAEQVRQRLVALLDKSTRMEDMIKIEAELERVTQTVELLKGKIQYLSSQVAFSTLRVQFNSPLPQKQMVAAIPFQWVRDLGNGLVTGTAQGEPDTSPWRFKVVNIALPAGYIRYYERDDLAEAMSADGVYIKLHRHENYKGGDLGFWGKLARKSLVENRGLHVTGEADVDLGRKGNSGKAHVITGTRDLGGGKQNGYLLAIVADTKHVYVMETWGDREQFGRDQAALEQAVKTICP